MCGEIENETYIYPTIIPNWDHSPRSGKNGYVLVSSNPQKFEDHCRDVFFKMKDKDASNNYFFLKSWNEWGEGNYVEPDLRYGRGWLNAIKMAFSSIHS